MLRHRLLPRLAVGLFLATAACSSDSSAAGADTSGDTTTVEEDPAAEACEHSQEGPYLPVTASSDAPPDVTRAHTAIQITLAAGAGSVSYAAAEAGEHRFFLSNDIPLSVTTVSGDVVAEATSTPEALCAEVVVSHTMSLGVGTYTLTFGPSSAESVTLVTERLE